MQGNLGVHAELDKSMYHFYLQEEGQPAQLSQKGLFEESKLFQNDASESKEKDGHLTCFAEQAASISTFLDTQDSFQEARMKDVCERG